MEVCPAGTNPLLHSLTSFWQRGGWVGVDLFFVLSGFLISGLLFREHQKHGHLSVKNFLTRRGFKIYPPFFVFIFATVAERFISKGDILTDRFIYEVVFLQNYGGGLWDHTWSLAVEEHFYLLLPLVLMLSLKTSSSHEKPFAIIPALFIGIAVITLGLRLYTMASVTPYRHMTHLYPTHLRIDSLFCGVALGYFYHYYPERFRLFSIRYKKFALPSALLLFVPAFLFKLETTPFIYTYGFSLLWLGGGLLLFGLISSEPGPSPVVNTVSFIGSRSYSIYLWHMAMASWGIAFLKTNLEGYWNWYWYAGFYMAGSLLIGITMSAVVEYPLLRLRDRFYPSRS